MKVRLSEIVFILLCLVMLALGAILLIKADQQPVPGILMVGAALMALIWRYRRRRYRAGSVRVFDENEKSPGQWDMEIYEQQAERRRSGESDI